MSIEVEVIQPSTHQPKKFTRYSRAEIRSSWTQRCGKDIGFFKKDNLTIYATRNVAEAIVVAALFIRELDVDLEDTWYDCKNGYLALDLDNAVSLAHSIFGVRALTKAIIQRVIRADLITSITRDAWGERLFDLE
jgi:hypothetical protein